MSGKAFGDGAKTYPTCDCLVDKTINMRESYLTLNLIENLQSKFLSVHEDHS